MTKEQHAAFKQDLLDIEAFEEKNGLQESFGEWYDNKTKQRLFYVNSNICEDVDDNNKIIKKFIINFRYVAGRARSFGEKVWNSKVKDENGQPIKRFAKL